MGTYKYLIHTADLRVRGEGKSFEEALSAVAEGMISWMVDLGTVEEKEEKSFEVEGIDIYELVNNFLSEILFIFDTEFFVPKRYEIKKEDTRIVCRMFGERLDENKHRITGGEIKAVTYNDMIIKEEKGKWIIEVTFDI